MADTSILEKKLKRAERKVENLEKEFENKTRELYLAHEDLKERVKELDCLYGISRIVESAGTSLETIFRQTAELIPPSWLYPDITCARITLGDQTFATENWQDPRWIQSRDIMAHNQKCGSVEVGYTKQRPKSSKGPFLAKERSLLDAIAERLGKITERVRAEEKYHSLFESSRDSIMTLEPPKWKFTSGNPATVQMFRAKDEAEFISREPWAVSPKLQPDGRTSVEKAKEMIETAVRDGSNFFEWTHKRLDDEEFPASVLITRMERDGKMILQATVRDITAQKEAEEKLQLLNEELAEKNVHLQQMDELKSQFVANVSHEIRNPLAAIKGTLYLLQKEVGDSVSERQQTLMTMSEKTVDRLVRLVTNLLDLSKIETGRMQLKRDRFDLPTFVDELLTSYYAEFEQNNIKLKKDIQDDLGVVVADQDKLSQVFINLISNAIKYTPKNSMVGVRVYGTDGEIRCEISDGGPGIPEEEREKIFNKFERVTAEKEEGTGLGLAIAKDIVKLHKGRIWVESEMGKGSTFIFVIPREQHAGQ